MPQMMPFNWMLMYILFLIMFIFYMTMIYYVYLPNSKKNNKQIISTKYNWKW